VTTQEQPHQIFTRKGADLFMKHNISLIQSLLGFNFSLPLLDGSKRTVYTGPGEVMGDHDKRILRGLGLPFFGDEELKGHILVEFKVEMPKRGQLSPQQLQALIATLPGKVNPRPND
jgi:DnaJ family protein A protein 2